MRRKHVDIDKSLLITMSYVEKSIGQLEKSSLKESERPTGYALAHTPPMCDSCISYCEYLDDNWWKDDMQMECVEATKSIKMCKTCFPNGVNTC